MLLDSIEPRLIPFFFYTPCLLLEYLGPFFNDTCHLGVTIRLVFFFFFFFFFFFRELSLFLVITSFMLVFMRLLL